MKNTLLRSKFIIVTSAVNIGICFFTPGAYAQTAADWTDLQSILKNITAIYTSPPTNTVTPGYPDAPVMGNGDVEAVVCGDHNNYKIIVSKNNYWSAGLGNGGGGPVRIGGINITKTGSTGTGSYSLVHDVSKSEARGSLPMGGTPVSITSWTSATTNIIVSKIVNGNNQALSMQVDTWVPDVTGFASTTGANGSNGYIKRDTKVVSGQTQCFASIATRIIGADATVTSAASSNGKVARSSFTIPASATVYVVCAVSGGKNNTACVDEAIAMLGGCTTAGSIDSLRAGHDDWWKKYWLMSYARLNDAQMEKYYYGNLYIFATYARDGKVAAGLHGAITTDGPNWNGGYTTDYNFEMNQLAGMTSNRTDFVKPFFDAIINNIPRGISYAKTKGAPGILFTTDLTPWVELQPYCNWDCDMRSNACLCATIFRMYYDLTQDDAWLRNVAYPYYLKCLDFYVYWMTDTGGRYVIKNSNAREGYSPGNFNSILDLSYLRMATEATLDASIKLGLDAGRRAKWQDILNRLSALPTMTYNGKVCFKEAESMTTIALDFDWPGGANAIVTDPVFPSQEIGLGKNDTLRRYALNTLETMQSWNQPNNWPRIFTQAARVGWDAKDLKQKIKDGLTRHQFKNFATPLGGHGCEGTGVVEAINNMLLQSFSGTIRLFPCWPVSDNAYFKRLRAKGAFLVDAALNLGVVKDVTIYSEKGRTCTVLNPWSGKTLYVAAGGRNVATTSKNEVYTFNTDSNVTYTLTNAPPTGVVSAVNSRIIRKPSLNQSGLSFSVPGSTTRVRLDLYDLTGRHMRSVLDKNLAPGDYKVIPFDKSNSSQVYIIKVKIGRESFFLMVPRAGRKAQQGG